MTITFYLIAIILLTYWGAWISACETALFSLPSPKLKAYKNDRNPTKRLIAQLLSKSRDLLVTIFMVNTFLNILLQNVASSMFGSEANLALKVGVPFLLTLILGEIIPKYYGMQNNVSFSLDVANRVDLLHKLLKPIRNAVIKITLPISRALFFFLQRDENLSLEELAHVVKTSEEKGLLEPDESLLVRGYLNLQDTEVKEIMRPRGDMITYDIDSPLSKLQYYFADQKVTRIPVIHNSLDNLLGILDAYTFFVHQNTLKKPEDLIPLLKKAQFIPESTHARNLLRKISNPENELVMVVDEYGAIAGLVTREDLIEVVVGQIEDSRDQKADYVRSSKTEIIASGKMEISAFNQLFNSSIESKNNLVSLGGWLTEELGDIPKAGTRHETDEFIFKVLSSTPLKIDNIYVRKKNG